MCFFISGSTVYVFVSYNGVWEMHGRKWYFKDAEGEVIPVENDVTYLQLLDILHETFQVDREVYELKLEVPYVCGDQPFAPVQLKNDRQVRVFLGISLKERPVLCVIPVKKNVISDPSPSVNKKDTTSVDPSPAGSSYKHLSEVGTFVPVTDPMATIQLDIPQGGPTGVLEAYEYDPYVNDDPVGNCFEDNDDGSEDDSYYSADVSNEELDISQAQQVEEE